ncbi:hypothetical protein [Legionella jordanis]|uniref:Uncharacterized protein n=1 Tax=Legionella jordanis TaxID=456 RepID=A0A0W0V978_9GAMM|nr:hypothetical protein [Legionella jordanis]KTD16650.1 hypothetical protein Ljor_0956 [Legionella jordanis]RMX03815.1 hypothetical protein EAW55_05505 [Legionella jordanis]RMX22123.1 hypothetical protein EAS68_00920 [Legionella jordanis]VEH11886.1 Uncharacterised protein [Legionella jordanis]
MNQFFSNVPSSILVQIYSNLSAHELVQTIFKVSSIHRAAALKALFQKDDEQARDSQVALLKGWASQGIQLGFPQDEAIIWDAISRPSWNSLARCSGLAVLAKKAGISLQTVGELIQRCLSYFNNNEGNQENQLTALDCLANLSRLAHPKDAYEIEHLLTEWLAEENLAISDKAWDILKQIKIRLPLQTRQEMLRVGLCYPMHTHPFASRMIQQFFASNINECKEVALDTLKQDAPTVPQSRRCLLLLEKVVEQLAHSELDIAFSFVYKFAINNASPMQLASFKTLAALTPRLNEEQRQKLFKIIENCYQHRIIKTRNSLLEDFVKPSINSLSSLPEFDDIVHILVELLNANVKHNSPDQQELKQIQLCLEVLCLSAKFLTQQKRLQIIKTIEDLIVQNSHAGIREAAFNALNQLAKYLSKQQIHDFFSHAMYLLGSGISLELAISMLTALAGVLESSQITDAVTKITHVNWNSSESGLLMNFFIAVKPQLKPEILQIIQDAILKMLVDGGENQDFPIAEVSKLYMPQMPAEAHQGIFDMAMKTLDEESCPNTKSVLQVIYGLSNHLSRDQIDCCMRKLEQLINRGLKNETTMACMDTALVLFHKASPDVQMDSLAVLVDLAANPDYFIKHKAIESLSVLIIAGHLSQDIKKEWKIQRVESSGIVFDYINFLFNLCEQIKESFQASTLSDGPSI